MPATSQPGQPHAQMCEVGRRLYARGLVSGTEGNLSCRLDDGSVLCTPTLVSKGFLQPEDLCTVNSQGERIAGSRRPTSEIRLHLAVYDEDECVRAVVHSHPPHATAFALAHADVPGGMMPEGELFLGEVPRIPYETPGTEAVAGLIRPYVGKTNVALLANHGAIAWGRSLEQAWLVTETLESYCRILLLSEALGGGKAIPEAKRAELRALRASFDGKSA